jgi:nucleotide-binding universal stress UspA family protein
MVTGALHPRRILAVYAGTRESLHALDRAADIAEACDAALVVVTSAEEPPAPLEPTRVLGAAAALPDLAVPAIERQSRQYIDEAREHLASRQLEIDYAQVADGAAEWWTWRMRADVI